MIKIFDSLDLFIFDLDGVIYEGNTVIPGALELLNKLSMKNKLIYALTNNSTLTRAMYSEKLEKMGINIPIDKIITSGFATAQYLAHHGGKGKSAFIVGEIGLMLELESVGINPVNKDNLKNLPATVDFVIAGLDRNLHYDKISLALNYILNGASFIASNNDPTLPSDIGPLPGAGVMIAAISNCTGLKPSIIIGKPNPLTIYEILKIENISPDKSVIIGDRFITDISAGINAGIKTIMVLTGAGKSELDLATKSTEKPYLIADSVADLLKLI